jgi:DNA-binding GntR family transcriptional regulator
MKPDTVYKRAYNATLPLLRQLGAGAILPSENELSAALGVSRTTVRKVIAELARRRYVTVHQLKKVVRLEPGPDSAYPDPETLPTSQRVEHRFMDWIVRGDVRPGAQINELDLARQFGVGTNGIREFLNGFRRFGLIEKRANAGWSFKGFTPEFAAELFEIREMFELRSAVAFADLAPADPLWKDLDALESEHRRLLGEIDHRFNDFSDLDDRFHRFINNVVPNRFIADFYDIIAFVFHYHYQWSKTAERERNERAVIEHLAYIAALKLQDRVKIVAACRRHLDTARVTLFRSTAGMS